MKKTLCTVASTVMLIVPWTIFLVRQNAWALESPAAEIIIASYAAFMILSGVFTILIYAVGKVQNTWMKVCLVINSLYAAGGVMAIILIAAQKFMQ